MELISPIGFLAPFAPDAVILLEPSSHIVTGLVIDGSGWGLLLARCLAMARPSDDSMSTGPTGNNSKGILL